MEARMVRVDDYQPGDKVQHHNGATGVVRRIVPCSFSELGPAVEVEFDPVPNKPGQKWPYSIRKWFGEYPQKWLDQFGLEKL
jgi:hypothetical protein